MGPAARAPPGRGVDPPSVPITIETAVGPEMAAGFYDLYRDTFGDLATRAMARQLLHEDEFLEEMHDERVLKYVAWDEDGHAIGMSTITRHLETVPWISPAYFAHHYPEHTARGAVFYLGFTLVHRQRRQSLVFQAMIEQMIGLVLSERGVCGWDICAYNNRTMGFADNIERLLHRNASVTVEPVDLQTYYVATLHGPLPPAH